MRNGHLEEATETVQWALPRLDQSTPPALLVRLARVAHKLHMSETERLVELASRHPELTTEAAAELAGIGATS